MIGYKDLKDELQEYVLHNESLLRLFKESNFLISGAGGLIGSYLIYLIIEANRQLGLEISVTAIDRNAKLLERFSKDSGGFVTCHNLDVCADLLPEGKYDYVIHAASNTSPADYARKPIDTIWTNVYGAKALMDLSLRSKAKRFLFCSSVEAYGRNNGDVDEFTESYSGYVDSNTIRAGYPASKRCVEALCNAYAAEHADFDFVIARIGRFYGPTVVLGDTKAPSQFIGNAVCDEDVILKSDGAQLFSWGYVGDCATAILTLIAEGRRGEAYNVADPQSVRTLKDFAMIAANAGGVSIRFVEQSAIEKAGYSKITKAVLDVSKLQSLGWAAKIHLETGIPLTINYLKKEAL